MGKAPDVNFPDPIDPAPAIAQQGEANIESAIATSLLNQINQIGPGGSTTFSPTGQTTQVGDFAIPQFQQETTLSPQAQAQFEQQQQIGNQLSQLAGFNIQNVAQAQADPFSTAGLPEIATGVNAGQVGGAPAFGQPIQTSIQGFDPQAGVPQGGQFQFAQLPQGGRELQGNIGADFGRQGNELEAATFNRISNLLQPEFQRQLGGANLAISERGLPIGGQASNALLNPIFSRQNQALSNAAFQAVGAGRQEQGRLFQQQQQARGQQFGQALGAGQFANQAQQQAFGQAFGAQGFQNQAQQQAFNQALTNAGLQTGARQQGIQERAFTRNIPINEIAALLGTAPGVQVPNFIQTPGVGVQAPDIIGGTLGAANITSQNAQAAADAAARQNAGLFSGLFGLGGSLGSAAILASDRRVKRDIKRIGTWRDNALYSFRYVGEFVRKIGVMAQEVDPRAVLNIGGTLHVNYGAL